MIRTNGYQRDFTPLKVVSEVDHIYIVQWDFAVIKQKNEETGEMEDSSMATWMQEMFHHKPTEEELRSLFTKYYNEITDNKILAGYVWNEMPVWLSVENQRNYSTIYNLAAQGVPGVFPTRFKFGTDNEPIYYDFETLEELASFYLPAVKYIEQCYTEGWELKDSIDYSLYGIEKKEN